MEQEQKINSNEFISIGLTLCEQACLIIREVYNDGITGIKFKVGDDPVTHADMKSQWVIENGLEKLYPGIQIVGEEGSNGIESEFDFETLTKDKFNFGFKSVDYDLKDCCVYIDPLDGTRAFVKSNLQAVTCLITLTYKNKPVVGIMGYPYPNHTKHKPNPNTEIYVGQIDTPKVVRIKWNDTKYEEIEEFKPFGTYEKERTYKMYMSINHRNPLIDKLALCFPGQVEPLHDSGCGNKMLGIVTRKADCHIYSTGGASRWDIGPGCVMVRALGGHCSDLRGDEYEYLPKGDMTNLNGLLCINDKKVVPELTEKFMKILKEIGQDTGPITGL